MKKPSYKKYAIISLLAGFIILANLSFRQQSPNPGNSIYKDEYRKNLLALLEAEKNLSQLISGQNIQTTEGKAFIKNEIAKARIKMKAADFWLRYLEPTAYHKINGPLAVEWETEVFEKFERPYKREGAGFTLAENYLDEKEADPKQLKAYIDSSINSMDIYFADSVARNLDSYHHFFLANRLFLLNLSAIYTTGFECPDTRNIIPELVSMLRTTKEIYAAYNSSFPAYPLNSEYLNLYDHCIEFADKQNSDPNRFDHFHFIKDYVNPLFALNQQLIRNYQVVSNSFNDYSLDDNSVSIFDKSLYKGQNTKGIYLAVDDTAILGEIKQVGKLLFYDPILSVNNQRSCASCHKPDQYFTDTAIKTAFQLDHSNRLPRNTISLVNTVFNHLAMLDGKHTSLLNQALNVTTNPIEMGSTEKEIVEKVMSCKEYAKAFRKFVRLTPNAKEISLAHIVSAVIIYYSGFSNYYADFDEAMNQHKTLEPAAVNGFNIFMSKAQCGTCHFVPQFNGVKPPYINTEFEVIGVPSDTFYRNISADSGRFLINPVPEMLHAFRTATLRNARHTKPYMHNGVFNTLDEVIDFYNAGGGKGKGLKIINQTLAEDSLKLTAVEKKDLLAFIHSLDEDIPFEPLPQKLPVSSDAMLNDRKPSGTY